MDHNDEYVGQQILRWRKRRGLTQEVLADRVGISRALVGHYETGLRALDSRERLYLFAQALQVSVGDLTGHAEERLNPNVIEFHAAVPRIEAALMCAGNTSLSGPLPNADVLDRAADRSLATRAATDYQQLGKMLPDLITGLYQHTQGSDERAASTAWSGLVRAAGCTALATKGLGHTSLAWIAANAAAAAAEKTGSPADRAFAAYMRAQVMLATPGAVAGSLSYALAALNQIEPEVDSLADREQWGMLHLHAGLTASALGNDPSDHQAAVDEMAAITGEGSSYHMFFGPRNIKVWRMSWALERRQGDLAVQIAETLDPRSIGSADRMSRYYIELARAQFMEGDARGAESAIRRAEIIAPQQVRTRTTVRELVGSILRQQHRALASSELGQLAQRVGAVPGQTA